jgi:hypothetical protein
MRQRIRNILFETLILESLMFKEVAVKYNGTVYAEMPFFIHAYICDQIANEIGQEYENVGVEFVAILEDSLGSSFQNQIQSIRKSKLSRSCKKYKKVQYD